MFTVLFLALTKSTLTIEQVRQLEGGTEGLSGKGPESSCLSELRILCSLGKHPCIVSFYGHQFISKPDARSQLIIYMEYIQGGSLEVPFMAYPNLWCGISLIYIVSACNSISAITCSLWQWWIMVFRSIPYWGSFLVFFYLKPTVQELLFTGLV